MYLSLPDMYTVAFTRVPFDVVYFGLFSGDKEKDGDDDVKIDAEAR